MMTASAWPEQGMIEALAAAGPDAIDAGNVWLAAWCAQTGRSSVTIEGVSIPLPEAVGDDIEGCLDDPLLVGCAVWGATLSDEGTARRVQAALEDVGGRGWAAVVGAAVAAVGSIVGGALNLGSANKQQKTAKEMAAAAAANLEAAKLTSAAQVEAAAQRTKQVTTMVIGGLAAVAIGVFAWTMS